MEPNLNPTPMIVTILVCMIGCGQVQEERHHRQDWTLRQAARGKYKKRGTTGKIGLSDKQPEVSKYKKWGTTGKIGLPDKQPEVSKYKKRGTTGKIGLSDKQPEARNQF